MNTFPPKIVFYTLLLVASSLLVFVGKMVHEQQKLEASRWEVRRLHSQADVKQSMIDFEINIDEAILMEIEANEILNKFDKAIKMDLITKKMTPVQCLADNIYYEAANEPEEGKVAVAQVTMNRVADGVGGNTVCQVVYFKKRNPNTGKKEAAFSWTLGSKWRPKGKSHAVYSECMEIAKAVLNGLRSEIIGSDVEFYHADYIKPSWSKDHEFVAQIGQHVFYR